MIVLSVSRTYWNRGVRSHRKGTKQIWQVYYLDDNREKLHTNRVNWAQAMYYKSQIKRKRRVFCASCGFEGIGFYKNDKEILSEPCPDCDDEDVTLLPANSIEQLEKVLDTLQK
jgi:hypothetical protein